MVSMKQTLFLFILLITSNGFATINVFSDRNPVNLDDSFTLIFQSRTSSIDSPDFSPLEKDFDILSNSQSSQIQIINGQQSQTIKWTLTVMAKRTGNLIIPAIYFGQEQSAPSNINIQEANKMTEPSQGELFLEVEAIPTTPYVQSQVIYTVRMFYALSLQEARLSEPNDTEILIKKLGEDRNYQTQRQGKQFKVIERKYALFPQKSGSLTLQAIELKAQVIDKQAPRYNFFSQARTHIKRVRSKTITLDVLPIPSTFKGKNWLPARNLILKDSFSDKIPEFKVGEPVTRTLSLLADGLTVGQLPEFIIRESTLKQYTDQPTLQEQIIEHGLGSIREEKIAIIPSKAGEYMLPAIEIPWWNTQTNKMAIIKLPARSITVAPTTIQEQTPVTPQITVIPPDNTYNYYKWLTFIFAFGWIVTLMTWGWVMRTKTSSQEKGEKDNDKKMAIKNLKEACHNNNAQKAKDALLAWHRQTGVPNSVLGQHCDQPLQAEIQKLNQFLYGQTIKNWQGNQLWKEFKAHQPKKERQTRNMENGLKPLYLQG